MKCETVNKLRRLIILFLLCLLFSYLTNDVFNYPLWIDICIMIAIILPIDIKVLPRLDVKEV